MSTLSVRDMVVGEDAGFVDVLVALDVAAAHTVTVNYATSAGSAVDGGDYVSVAGMLAFAPGEMTKTVRVAIVNDTTAEPAQNFFLSLSGASGATIARGAAAVTIHDNDAPTGVPVVKVADLVVDEQSGEAVFVVTLDRPNAGTVTMSYYTQDRGAFAGSDYVAQNGNLVFTPGSVVQTVRVPLIDDGFAEARQSFDLVLTNFTGASAPDNVATATIHENDGPAVARPWVWVEDAPVMQEDQVHAEFVVRLSQPGTGPVTVSYATRNGSATSTGDFQPVSGTLTFAPGEMVKVVSVLIADDSANEPIENLFLDLSSPQNATLARETAMATVVDNDLPPRTGTSLYLTIDPLVVDEQSRMRPSC